MTNASIITIGDELLIGQVIDTNSAWIAQELNKIGIFIKSRVAVGDMKQDIWEALDQQSNKAQLVIITGGLGPTADDITKPLLCEYFGGEMVMHAPTLAYLEHLFANVLQRPMIERNRKQAEVPNNCIVLKNDVGTAPGMLFEKNDTLFISLPGVPHEMKWIMQHQAIPYLLNKLALGAIEHRTLLTAGVGESFLAEKIKDFEATLPNNIKLAYLPNYGMVRLRLTTIGNDAKMIIPVINQQFEQLKELVAEYLIVDTDITLQEAIGKLLLEQNATLSTAESCTGGYIAHLITSISGSSAYFLGSVVSYANSVKTEILNVDNQTIETEGAVSEAVVLQMVKNVRKKLASTYSIAVSGIMGPSGGSNVKPVGTVWIAVADENRAIAKKFHFKFDRERNIQLTAINALNLLRMLIVDNR